MKSPLLQLAVLIGISAAAAGLTWTIKGPPEKTTVLECVPEQLEEDEICLKDVTGNVLWVDARSRKEWQDNGLENSVLWNLDPKEDQQQFEAETALRVLDAELVVVYCGSAACGTSRQIADRIRNLELGPPVKVLFGGWDSIKDSSSKP